MAKKKVPTIEDAIKSLKEVAQRVPLSNYYYVNNVMVSKVDNQSEDEDDSSLILLNVESALWKEIVDDESFVKFEIDDPTIKTVSGKYRPYFKYGSDDGIASEMWIPIDVTEELFKGKVFKIRIKEFEYEIPINRELMPLKLKKAEYENISYRVFTENNPHNKKVPIVMLAIKKYFSTKDVEGGGFSIIKLYQVI